MPATWLSARGWLRLPVPPSAEHVLRNVPSLDSDERHVVKRMTVRGQAVLVALTLPQLQHAVIQHGPNKSGEARTSPVRQEILLDIECNPAARMNQVVCSNKGPRGNVAEAQRGDTRKRVETVTRQLTPLIFFW